MTPDVLADLRIVNAAASGQEVEWKSTLRVLLDMNRRRQQEDQDFGKWQPCIEAVRKWSPTNMAVSVVFHFPRRCSVWKRFSKRGILLETTRGSCALSAL
jgi:hypothetical protein